MRVLVVEDEPDLARSITRALRDAGFATDVAYDGEAALDKIARSVYDVVVLDRALPKLDGDEVCRRVVATGAEVKIVMLTARDAIEERVAGLELGADDYVPKPVALAELIARVRTVARRRGSGRGSIRRWGDLELDSGRRSVARASVPITLARKEFALLEELLVAEGAVVSADRLLSRVWDESYNEPFENTVRVTVMRLRRKLGDPPIIETVVGAGYRLR
jgi:DNA-binding response OmpR family regulator